MLELICVLLPLSRFFRTEAETFHNDAPLALCRLLYIDKIQKYIKHIKILRHLKILRLKYCVLILEADLLVSSVLALAFFCFSLPKAYPVRSS